VSDEKVADIDAQLEALKVWSADVGRRQLLTHSALHTEESEPRREHALPFEAAEHRRFLLKSLAHLACEQSDVDRAAKHFLLSGHFAGTSRLFEEDAIAAKRNGK
jgi:hypothetical protein